MRRLMLTATVAACLGGAPVTAGLIDTVVDTTLAGATIDGTVNPGEYVGTVSGGGGGFGGQIGPATMSVDSDPSGIYLSWDGMGSLDGNAVRVYFDVRPGGFTDLSSAGGFNDNQDFGRERISRVARDGLTLPFEADFGLILGEFFGDRFEAFELAAGGPGSLIFAGSATISGIGFGPSASTLEAFLPHSVLGTSPGDTIDFVVVHGNNQDFNGVFMADEGFPFQFPGGNPGNGPAVATDFHRLVSVIPEPSAIACLALMSVGLIHRRHA